VFQPEKVQNYLTSISERRLPAEDCLKRDIFKCGLWLLGIPAIIYGAIDRGVAAFSKPEFGTTDFSYCLIAVTILLGWVFIGMAEDPMEPLPGRVQNALKTSQTPPAKPVA
jgi:hypothetical protein